MRVFDRFARRSAPARAIAAFLAVASAVVPLGSTAFAAQTKVVTSDYGGSVMERYRLISQMRLQGTRVRIQGECMSACTMYLSLPNACVSPTAVLGFHGPRSRGQMQPMANSPAVQIMAAHYPANIRSWFMREAQYIPGDRVARLSGRQVIAMGARQC